MAKDEPKYDYKFVVLQEQVATEDLFEEKTHERVASTLDELVRTTDQGLTIGLEGGWGSGKSTVINLLKDKLSGDKDKTLFFVFDAWAHDGDPLRKIFLESLISSIDPDKKDQKLNQLSEEVSARKKSVTVETERSASRLGKLLSLFALVIPVGAALLSAVEYDKLLSPWAEQTGSVHWPFLIGIFLSLAPLWLVLWWCFYGDKDDKGNRKWDFIESESHENYTQDITEDGERTSIEFEKFFKDILQYVFSPNSNYKFERAIIVVDNLDRVEPEYAQNVWSTLQTFFQHRTSSLNGFSEKWSQQLWFLIPHDKEGIQRIWHNDNSADGGLNRDISSSFMEKCLQICVEVPPPVMSTWIKYFKTCVQKSLLGWPENYRISYVNSYIQCMSKLEISPSPRQIHAHINRAGVLALQWKDEFSAESYCIYSLCRKDMTEFEFRQHLLKDSIPKSFLSNKPLNNVKAELAGLLFGVKADKGMQLLLSPEIRECMKNSDGGKLKELSEIHREAFWLILRASKTNWMPTTEHDDDYKLCVIEALYKGFASEKSKIREFVAPIQNVMVNSIDRWQLDEYSFAEDINYLIELSEDKEQLLIELEKGIRARILLCTKDESFKHEELHQLKEMEDLLVEKGKPITKKHYPSLDYKKWQSWIKVISDKGVYFNSVLPKKDVFQQLIDGAGFNQPHLNKPNFNVLTETFKIYPDNKVWKSLIENLISWFNLPNRDYECNEAYEFAIELITHTSTQDKRRLKSIISEPPFWQAGVHSQTATNPALPLLVAMADTEFRGNSTVSPNIGSYFDSLKESNELADIYKRFKNADELLAIWNLAVSEENGFAREIIRTTNDPELFSIGASKVDEITWQSEEEVEEIVKKLSLNGAFKGIVAHVEKNPCLYGDNLFLFSKYGDEEIKREITSILQKTSRENWIQALEEESKILTLIPSNTPNFAKAWCDHIINIIKGDTKEPSKQALVSVIGLRNKVVDCESLYIPQLTQEYFNSKDNISNVSFGVLSDLFALGVDNVKQQVLEQRISHWIEYQNMDRLRWLLSIDIKFKNSPSQTIVADVTNNMKHATADELSLYKSINKKFGLGIFIEEKQSTQERVEDE